MNQFSRVDTMEQALLEELGESTFLDAITRALDYDTKEDIYKYIARCYDIDLEEVEEND